jgi:hypothetical protein
VGPNLRRSDRAANPGVGLAGNRIQKRESK